MQVRTNVSCLVIYYENNTYFYLAYMIIITYNMTLVGKAIFDTVDVLKDTLRVQEECKEANIIWLNDFAWTHDEQHIIEATAQAGMSSGSLLILYRPPHYPPDNKQLMKSIPVATSWSPNMEMYIIYKE